MNDFVDIDIKSEVARRLVKQSQKNVADLDDLIRCTKFSKSEIKTIYRGFKQVNHIRLLV